MQELFAAFGLDWRLLLIQAFNFAILLGVLWKFLYTPVLKMLDERRERIATGVRDAEEASRKLAVSEEQGKGIVADAAREAEGLVTSARARAEEKRVQLIAAAEQRADSILSEAAARAEEVKRQMLETSARDITKAAMLAAEKVLRQKNA